MHPNDADRMANSVGPDQTAPDLGLHCLFKTICQNMQNFHGMSGKAYVTYKIRLVWINHSLLTPCVQYFTDKYILFHRNTKTSS